MVTDYPNVLFVILLDKRGCGKMVTHPIGFLALWKSLITLSTSGFTVQFAPSVATVDLRPKNYFALVSGLKIVHTHLFYLD